MSKEEDETADGHRKDSREGHLIVGGALCPDPNAVWI